MSARSKRLLSATSILCCIIGAWLAFFPLHRSERFIRAWLLNQVPMGSTLRDVQALIKRRGWRVEHYNPSSGFLKREPGLVTAVVGSQSLECFLGKYQSIPFQVYVNVYWGFDTSGTLTDVWVRKTADGI